MGDRKSTINDWKFTFTPVLIPGFALWIKTVILLFVGFSLHIDNLHDALLVLINPIASILLLLGVSFYFTKKISGLTIFIVMIIASGILYGDLLYYRFYSDYVTVPILFQFKNVGGIGPSTFELISGWDILFFLDLIVVGVYLWKTRAMRVEVQRKQKAGYILGSVLVLLVTIGIGLLKSPYMFAESYDREQMVKAIGPYNYHLYDIGIAAGKPFSRTLATKADTKETIRYIDSTDKEESDLFGVAKGKNLVLVSMESTQNFVIGQKVHGKEITPFLNSLIEDSFYFSQIYDQTAQGKTSDSEFMVDNGLYPLASGSTFVQRPENTYRALSHLLDEQEDYYTAVFHGNDKTFWNRDKMYEALGYDRFFSKEEYKVTEDNSVNYGIKDIPFFQQSMDYVEDLPHPFYARFLMLTNHFPFLLDEEDQFIEEADTSEGVVNRYVTTVRYEDEAIKNLIEDFKKKGLYDDTVFVFFGDHYGISEKYETGAFELLGMEDTVINHMKLQQVPLIIHVPGEEGRTIDTLGGEIDIRPTILHLMGIESQSNLSFGHNLFTRVENHPVIFRNGDFITEKFLYKNNVCYNRKSEESENTSKCDPYKEIVRKELGLSDDIIYGDLLRFIKAE
ncbi:LTA synthase family protein [Rossellomorea marisflavi]|uniref:LTA synthase family protein n=1 Tax=Rossellomorea marisflavi TaxID=189381 RepID=UPI0028532E62|nr:LTA synthase family protein [Rossellomorea marisflavi]MDR4937004.1 LTA synthase family protein [Rossellomorea marisflavi]